MHVPNGKCALPILNLLLWHNFNIPHINVFIRNLTPVEIQKKASIPSGLLQFGNMFQYSSVAANESRDYKKNCVS